MKFCIFNKKESNSTVNNQKVCKKRLIKPLPLLNNTNESFSFIRNISTAENRKKTDKKNTNIRSLSLNQNFINTYHPKLIVKPKKISVTNLECILLKNITDKGRIRNNEIVSKQINDINDCRNNKSENIRKFSINDKNKLNISKDKSFNLHEEIKSNYAENTLEIIKNIKKDLYINKYRDYSLCQPNNRIKSKLPIARAIVEERKQKEKKLNFFMERANPLLEINPKNLINLVSQSSYLNQLEMFNRDKLKTSVI